MIIIMILLIKFLEFNQNKVIITTIKIKLYYYCHLISNYKLYSL